MFWCCHYCIPTISTDRRFETHPQCGMGNGGGGQNPSQEKKEEGSDQSFDFDSQYIDGSTSVSRVNVILVIPNK